jgi:cysteine-rich repeat protein
MRIQSTLLVAGAVLAALCSTAPLARGADSKECKASRKCRGAIVSSASKAATQALQGLDKCHAQRDAGKFAGDCNTRDLSSALSKGAGKIGKKCSAGDPVRCLFENCDPVSWITEKLGGAIRESGETVQGSPTIAGDKQRAKCHKAIGAARSSIAKAVMRQAIVSRKIGDAVGHCDFPALPQATLTAPASVASGLRAKISRACAGLTSEDVGSCSPLPDCVIAAGEQLASDLVIQFYSTAAVCGDGLTTPPNEECDDANADNEDGCSNECRLPVCGDNIKQTTEECDDNSIDTDDCVQCKAARCGDGALWTDKLPDGQDAEQCEDGNDVADDGCTNCRIDAVSCDPAVGYRVTMAIDYDHDQYDMNAITVNLQYPEGVSIPGTAQEQSVQDRIAVLASDPDDFLRLGNDRDLLPPLGTDDTLVVLYASVADTAEGPNDGIPPGDQYEVRFDCAAGAKFSGEDFSCTIPAGPTCVACTIDGRSIPATCNVRVSAP